jgi:hypothetical protein
MLQDQKKAAILGALKQVMRVYQGRGHEINEVECSAQSNAVHTILADNGFQSLKEEVEDMGVQVNIMAKEEHAPEVERQNRVLKERAGAMIQTMPHTKNPKKMKVALI